jgi:integrase
MPPRVKAFRIKAPRIALAANRLKLEVRTKPYDYTPVAPGISVGYRRTKSAGSWVMRIADGKGGNRIENIGTADDLQDANGDLILDFWQASAVAQREGQGKSAGAPATFSEALTSYAKDLEMHGRSPVNASVVRHHLAGHQHLLDKQVRHLTGQELTDWRDKLLANGVKPATLNRMLKGCKAALNRAAKLDRRIANRDAWQHGLERVPETEEPENRVLETSHVLKLVEAAYQLREDFGLIVEVLAVTGTRTSQACKLTVADFQPGTNGSPRLTMPPSKKGGRNRRISENKPVAISKSLAAKLSAAARWRNCNEPLLVRFDGTAWNPENAELWGLWREIAKSTGIDCTAYALRHSSIVRSLKAGTPVRIVASMHDTSVATLESTYSRHIGHYADEQMRLGLLDTSAPKEGNVVNLRG